MHTPDELRAGASGVYFARIWLPSHVARPATPVSAHIICMPCHIFECVYINSYLRRAHARNIPYIYIYMYVCMYIHMYIYTNAYRLGASTVSDVARPVTRESEYTRHMYETWYLWVCQHINTPTYIPLCVAHVHMQSPLRCTRHIMTCIFVNVST